MPELPEVETVKNGLSPFMVGRAIHKIELRRADLRVPFPENLAKVLKGRNVEGLSRRAKYLLAHLSGGQVMIVHLGMSGKMTMQPDIKSYVPLKHDHMIVHLSDGGGVVFNDARRFGMVFLTQEEVLHNHPALAHLGPEPLSNNFSGPVLMERLRGKKVPLKIALLDQRVVAGVGNIYASEALHLSHISPLRPAGTLKLKEAEALTSTIRDVLVRAIKAGGSTLKDFRQSDGSLGYFQHRFSVYDKEGEACPCCGPNGRKKAVIHKIVQGGRATYYCPLCQK